MSSSNPDRHESSFPGMFPAIFLPCNIVCCISCNVYVSSDMDTLVEASSPWSCSLHVSTWQHDPYREFSIAPQLRAHRGDVFSLGKRSDRVVLAAVRRGLRSLTYLQGDASRRLPILYGQILGFRKHVRKMQRLE